MHRSRKLINCRKVAASGSGPRPSRWTRAKKLPLSCTNRLRASQIAASMLVDSRDCRYSL